MNRTDITAQRIGSDSGGEATESRKAAQFIATLDMDSIPPEIVEKARTCVLYGFGIGLLCLNQATARSATQACVALDGAPGGNGATLLSDGRSGSICAAAFSNAVLLHSRCQEDTSGTAHLGVVVLAVALALAEARAGALDDFIPAVVAGYEVAGALEALLGRDTMAAGFRASPLYGSIAAAATASRMLRLEAVQTDAALANAAAFTGGTLQSIPEGSDEWRYQVGIAARNGLLAAELAIAGSVSAARSLEGPQGFAAAFARKPMALDELCLGRRWYLPAVTFKPYPVCAHNQTPTLVAARVHELFDPGEIKEMRIRVNPYVVPGMLERGPFTRVPETLMSTYFCCASACVHGTVSMSQLARFDDAAVAAMIDRTSIMLDPAIPFPSAAADITTHDGNIRTLLESKSFTDFSLDRQEVNAQLHRLAREEAVPVEAVGLLDAFAAGLPHASVDDISKAYAIARSGSAAAATTIARRT